MTTKDEQNAELLAYSMARWAPTEFRSFAVEDDITVGIVELAAIELEFLNTEHLRPIGKEANPPAPAAVEDDDDDAVDETLDA
jgi:hypothetical protein